MPIDALGERIAASARIHAATYELLVMLREYDEGRGWNNGFLSCAHWLHWRTGIDLGAAREKVRVAGRWRLPRISAAIAARTDLLREGAGVHACGDARDGARCSTSPWPARPLTWSGSSGRWRRVDRVVAAHETDARHLSRQLTTWVDDDGMVVIRGRLTPEVGAVVQRALEAAADRLWRETRTRGAG